MNSKVFPTTLVSLFAVFALVSSPEARAGGKKKSKAADNKLPSGGYKPTNDIEEKAWKLGTKVLNEELGRMKERCGFTIPVEIVYAVPMKEWVAAEGWGLRRGCSDEIRSGGCVNLSWCGSEVVSQLWFSGCGSAGEGPRTRYKGWNAKVKKLVCRGEASPPDTSAMDRKHSKMKAVLSKDGTLTVTMHPSDANISYDFWEYLSPRIEAD